MNPKPEQYTNTLHNMKWPTGQKPGTQLSKQQPKPHKLPHQVKTGTTDSQSDSMNLSAGIVKDGTR